MPQYQETDSIVVIITVNNISFYETAICREIFFRQYFCEILENSSSTSKYVPKSFRKFTKKHQWRSLMLVKLQAFTGAEQPPDAICGKVFLERCSQNSQENTCARPSISIKLHFQGCKKETLTQVFSCEFSKISKNTFFYRTHPDDCFCFQLFRSSRRRCSMKRCVLENFAKLAGKHPWFAKFQKHLFYRTPLNDCFWLFRATLLKWDTANSVWKTSDEYSVSRNTNLSTVQVYHFFFQQDKLSVYVFIGLHCLLPEAAIRVEVFCKKRCS